MPFYFGPEAVRRVLASRGFTVSHSPRAASALVRLCLEKLLEQWQAGDGNLFQKIGNLVDRGLNAEVAESMHALRVYGNDVIHHVSEIMESDSAETAVGLLEMLNYIVEQLITEKAKRDALIAMMPAGKQNSIQKQIDK